MLLTRRSTLTAATAAVLAATTRHPAAAAPVVRVGALQFGTAMWELDVIHHHQLDAAEGFTLEVRPFGGNDSADVALMGRAVDLIVEDWLFVSRQRTDGAMLTFIPYSANVGMVMVRPDSGLTSLPALKGKKLGVAGGKLDKSWLIMQGFSRIIQRWDIAEETEVVYAAPPLLNEKLKSGELDAVLNYWHWCARLESLGYPFVISVAAAMEALAVPATTPQLGYVMHESWAAANRSTVQAFARASRAAKRILQASDEEWQRLRPLIRAESDAVLDLLMYRYREGIVQAWGEFERERAAVLYAYLAKQGGADLVGRATELAPGTFWADVTF